MAENVPFIRQAGVKGTFRSKSRFFIYFNFRYVQSFSNMCLKGFVEIRKIPEVIGIWVASNAWVTPGHSALT